MAQSSEVTRVVDLADDHDAIQPIPPTYVPVRPGSPPRLSLHTVPDCPFESVPSGVSSVSSCALPNYAVRSFSDRSEQSNESMYSPLVEMSALRDMPSQLKYLTRLVENTHEKAVSTKIVVEQSYEELKKARKSIEDVREDILDRHAVPAAPLIGVGASSRRGSVCKGLSMSSIDGSESGCQLVRGGSGELNRLESRGSLMSPSTSERPQVPQRISDPSPKNYVSPSHMMQSRTSFAVNEGPSNIKKLKKGNSHAELKRGGSRKGSIPEEEQLQSLSSVSPVDPSENFGLEGRMESNYSVQEGHKRSQARSLGSDRSSASEVIASLLGGGSKRRSTKNSGGAIVHFESELDADRMANRWYEHAAERGIGVQEKTTMTVTDIVQDFTTNHVVNDNCLPMLVPGSKIGLCWNILMLTITTLIGILVPFCFGFWGTTDLGTEMVTAFQLIDIFLIIDIFVRFRTAIKSSTGEVVTDGWTVASRYFKTWFLANILAACPTNLVNDARVVLALKLLRIMEIHRLLEQLTDDLRQFRLTGMKIALSLCVAAHIMACAWRMVQIGGIADGDDDTWWQLYVSDVYWVAMTMTTVGYGDIKIDGTRMRLFASLCMLVGACVFGFMLSSISAWMRNIFDDEISGVLTEVKGFLVHRNIPVDLQIRVERSIRESMMMDRKMTIKPAIFAKLSQNLQCDLSLELLRGVILEFPLFAGAPRPFTAEIAHAHIWVRALPGDVVLDEGQLVRELVFVVQGEIMVIEPIKDSGDDGCTSINLSAGAWLGESCLFDASQTREYSAVAIKNSEFAVLAAEAYHRIKKSFPRLLARHEHLESELETGVLTLDGLRYRQDEETKAPKPRQSGWLRSLTRQSFKSARQSLRSLTSSASRRWSVDERPPQDSSQDSQARDEE